MLNWKSQEGPFAMSDTLTIDMLSQRSGETPVHLDEWRSLGLIGRMGDETFAHEDVHRVSLIQLLVRRGIPLAAIAQADRVQAFLHHYIAMMFPQGVGPTHSLNEAAQLVEMKLDELRRFWDAAGRNEQVESLAEEDVEALRALKAILNAGLPEEALIQLVRVYADALSRVAEAEVRREANRRRTAVSGGAERRTLGPVLYREGDYLGTSVDIAARLAASPQRHQVLVSAAVRKEAAGIADMAFVPLGKQQQKGLADEVELFEVVAREAGTAAQRDVDPVCRMEVDTAQAAARLSLEGQELVFCSQDCLQRFVAAPDRYRTGRRSTLSAETLAPPTHRTK